ncbi:hypothetical protein [Piscibacillus salipiscarius]|uniref:hypothetical protein n=1 Tax=Piscibacillus salipiscarius TaxID=299480 RepID=UPI0006CF5149|nr:hypothetical protein [Piscibacillus salipiscarius]
MKVFINGCFHKIAYLLIQKLVDQDFEVYGYDDVEDEEKMDRYAMIGRHASFHLKEKEKQYDFNNIYDFTTENELCTYQENSIQTKIYLDQREDLLPEEVADWLASLQHFSTLPKAIYINGEEDESIHFIKKNVNF